MKKLLMIGMFVVGLFAARYPIAFEYYFINSCVNAGKDKKDSMVEYCACTLNEIEKKYTLNEFVNKMQNDKKAFLQEIAKRAIPHCIDKLAK